MFKIKSLQFEDFINEQEVNDFLQYQSSIIKIMQSESSVFTPDDYPKVKRYITLTILYKV